MDITPSNRHIYPPRGSESMGVGKTFEQVCLQSVYQGEQSKEKKQHVQRPWSLTHLNMNHPLSSEDRKVHTHLLHDCCKQDQLVLLSRVKKEKARLQHVVWGTSPEQILLGLHFPGHHEQPVPLHHPLSASGQTTWPRWFTAAAHPGQIRKKNLYNYPSWLLFKYLPALNTKRLCKWSRDSYCSKLIFLVQYYANCINFILLLLQAAYPKALIR